MSFSIIKYIDILIILIFMTLILIVQVCIEVLHIFCHLRYVLFYSVLSHNLGRMSLQQSLSTLSCFQLPQLTWQIHSCPVFNIVFRPLLLTTSSYFLSLCPVGSSLLNQQALPNHLSFHFLTRVSCSLYFTIYAWNFLRISSSVTWTLYEIFNFLSQHLISKPCVLSLTLASRSTIHRDIFLLFVFLIKFIILYC